MPYSFSLVRLELSEEGNTEVDDHVRVELKEKEGQRKNQPRS